MHPTRWDEWVRHVFNHPVSDARWYHAKNVEVWDGTPDETNILVVGTFNTCCELTELFTDAQINLGLWYILDGSLSPIVDLALHPSLPVEAHLKVLDGMLPLFTGFFSNRCSSTLSHKGERAASPLNEICYMWWYVARLRGSPQSAENATFDRHHISVLREIVRIPHDACRESALQGISEIVGSYPSAGDGILEVLQAQIAIRPDLLEYARLAVLGKVNED